MKNTIFSFILTAFISLFASVGRAQFDPKSEALIRELQKGGHTLLIRHANAPGTFDPPGFDLNNCASQRNLSDEGREQAKALGTSLRQFGIPIGDVRHSQWCRCRDTAKLAFPQSKVSDFDALNSPTAGDENLRKANINRARKAISQHAKTQPVNQVFVTHMFNIRDITDESVAEGEIIDVKADGAGLKVVGRLLPSRPAQPAQPLAR